MANVKISKSPTAAAKLATMLENTRPPINSSFISEPMTVATTIPNITQANKGEFRLTSVVKKLSKARYPIDPAMMKTKAAPMTSTL